MGDASQTSALGSRKPIASGRRLGSASNGRSGSAASNINEAQGEEAYDRIRQLARGSNGIRNVTGNTNNSQRNSRTQSKPLLGARPWPPKPSARHTDVAYKADTTCRVITKEDDDIAKAIKLSLADATVAPPSAPSTRKTETSYDADIANAKFLSLSNDDDSSSTLSSSESSYNVLDALHVLYETMGSAAKVLEDKACKLKKVTAGELANCVREWEGTTFRAIHTLEAAENQRIKDIRMQLDFDKGVEEKHQKQLNATNKLWEAKMRDKEREWGKKMVDQKRLYEARVAEATPSSQKQSLGEEQMQSRSVKPTSPSPSPPIQVTATSPTREIATPNAEHTPNSFNTEAKYEASVDFLKQKIHRLCDENAALQSAQKTKDENSTLSVKKMKQRYEAQIRLLKNRAEELAAANAEVSQSKEGRVVRSEPPQRSGAVVSPGKRKLDNGVRSGGSRSKKTKNGLMD